MHIIILLPNTDKLEVINTSPFEISNFLHYLKKSKTSYCGIPGQFLSVISQNIIFSLSTLFNNLFSSGHFPDNWKVAHVIPIFKKSGLKNDKVNFRPISILPTLSKLCESIMHERLLSHCIANDIISERQAAYLKGDSTIQQLIYLVHYIRSNWGSSNIVQGAFLDISSAFDKIWHKGLIEKLKQIGLDGKLLELFKSYLSNRKQCVIVDGVKSSFVDIKSGVPQGSRLGPLLFIIYINDIVKNLENEILIFADDTTLLASGMDPVETSEKLNRDLEKISDWADKWKVTFNAKKSKDMIFSNKNLNNSPPLILNGVQFERVNKHKHLGIILTSDLDWSPQINEVCKKANWKLSVLRSVKLISRQTLDILYKVIVRSIIDYGLPIYGNNLKHNDLLRLENLQYRAAKVVSGALHYTSREKLNIELGWESIKTRIDYLGLCIFHKIHCYATRPLIRSCLTNLNVHHEYNLRGKVGYQPYPHYNIKFQNSFFPYISKLWNNLPLSLTCLDLVNFKEQLKVYLKPKRIKCYNFGSKEGNILLTRLRVGRSDLNLHKFTIGQTDDPQCLCFEKFESPEHFLLDCFLYTVERQNLFDLVEQIFPRFPLLSKKEKYLILTTGINNTDSLYNYTNSKIFNVVQKFLIETKRFPRLKL